MSRWLLLLLAVLLLFLAQLAFWACTAWVWGGADTADCAHHALMVKASVTLAMQQGPVDLPGVLLSGLLLLFMPAAATLPRTFSPQSYNPPPLLPPPRPL